MARDPDFSEANAVVVVSGDGFDAKKRRNNDVLASTRDAELIGAALNDVWPWRTKLLQMVEQ